MGGPPGSDVGALDPPRASLPQPSGGRGSGWQAIRHGRVRHGLDDGRTARRTEGSVAAEGGLERLIRLAREKLEGVSKRVADEDDVALAAFHSFCMGAREGRFPRLEDRQGLWRLLVRITAYKALDQVKHERRAKRGGGKVVGAGEFCADDSNGCDGLEDVIGSEPSPEFAALLAEEFEGLLHGLGDATLRNVAVWKMEGWSNAEIAEKLDCAERSVARKLSLVRKRLKERRGD